MSTKESKKGNTIAEQLEGLEFLDDVDEMLLDGSSATDVARYIQRTMLALKDVAHSTITKALRVRAKKLQAEEEVAEAELEGDLDVAAAEVIPTHPATTGPVYVVDQGQQEIHGDVPRTPTVLARTMYDRYVGGFDTLLEFESMYLAQRDRISRMMAIEERLGVPLEGTVSEIKEARMLLQAHTKAKVALGLSGQEDRFRVTLDIRPTRAKHGDAVAEVLEDPSKRHKILTAMRSLANLKELPEAVADAEAVDI